MWHGNFAVLVTALFLVRHLVFDLKRAGTCLNHLLCEQIGCFCIAEPGINVCDDRNNMGFMLFNLVHDRRRPRRVILFTCTV